MAYLNIARRGADGQHLAPKAERASGWLWRLRRHYERVVGHVPADCPLCQGQASGGRLCVGCLGDVAQSWHTAPGRCRVCCLALRKNNAVCPDCAQQKPAFDQVIAAFDYQAPGDLLIQHFKAGRRFGMARMLAEMLVQAVDAATPALPRNTILVPVPASRASILERGFNPSAEIARYLAYRLDLPCRPELLTRHHEGRRQKQLTRAQRAQSAIELYRCSARIEPSPIAVVDDVLTTGSTLHGIASQFKRAGATSVYGLVLARTPYR